MTRWRSRVRVPSCPPRGPQVTRPGALAVPDPRFSVPGGLRPGDGRTPRGHENLGSRGADGVGGVEAGGADGRGDAGEQPDGEGGAGRRRRGPRPARRRASPGCGRTARSRRAERGADDPAEQRQHGGLDDELGGDVDAAGAEGPAHTDLAAPLEHRDHHHVGDADAADDAGRRRRARAAGCAARRRSWPGPPARRTAGTRRPRSGASGRSMRAEHGAHRLDLVRPRPHVERRRRRRRVEQRRRRPGTRSARRRRCSGASGAGSRMPITANHCTARVHTRGSPSSGVMPSRAAASAPSTTVGTWLEAASRKRPCGERAADGVEHADVGGQHGDAAGDALGDVVVAPHGGVDVGDAGGRRHRADAPGRVAAADSGSVVVVAERASGRARRAAGRCRARRAGRGGRPGSTPRCRRPRPSRRCRWRCPSAVSAVREPPGCAGRSCRRAARSARRSRLRERRRSMARAVMPRPHATSLDDAAVEHRDAPRGARRDVAVVGDQHDRAAPLVQVGEQRR